MGNRERSLNFTLPYIYSIRLVGLSIPHSGVRFADFFFFLSLYIPFSIDSPFLSSCTRVQVELRNKEPIHATGHDRYTGTRQLPGSFHRNLLQIMQFPTVTD